MKRLLAGIAAAAGVACAPPPLCVARGTRVATPRGPRPVEDLCVGDEVLAVDPVTRAAVATRITHLRIAHRECGALTLGATTLTITSDHPVFDPEDGEFHPAGDWLLGKRSSLCVLEGELAKPMRVTAQSVYVGLHQVFDLTVESELHTFVAEGVVVHNRQPPSCSVPGTGERVYSSERDPGLPACTCDDGGSGGFWSCANPSSGRDAVCVECGGELDGGLDGG